MDQTYRPPNADNPKVFIVNDCNDDNAVSMQEGELARYIEAKTSFIGIRTELEAGFNMVNVQKTFRNGKRGGALVNAAKRSGTTQNGIDFGYFGVDRAFTVTTIGAETLYFAKYLGITDSITVLNTEKTVDFLIAEGFVSPDDRDTIIESQFRSSLFSPAVLAYLLERGEIPGTRHAIADAPDSIGRVCWSDNFTNLKLVKDAAEFAHLQNGAFIGTKLPAPLDRLPYYAHLSLVPDGLTALTRGSSGPRNDRVLMELVIKGGRAGDTYRLGVGDRVL